MTPWTRVLTGHPETLRCTQKLRASCLFAFVLQEQQEKILPSLQLDTGQLSCIRHYTLRGNNPKQALPLFRSKTAYYDILKVTPNATQSQIKTAYYKQSFIYHPDKNPGSEDATRVFSEISEAYTVLGNITLRRKYDRGILSESDVRGAGKPSSSKGSTSKATASTPHQQKARSFTQRGGKPIYDFDAFYKAHYGEQLEKEQKARAMKQRMEEIEKKEKEAKKQKLVLEILAVVLCASAGLLFYNLKQS